MGFCSEWTSTLATVGLGIMKVVSTAISLTLVDRIGRRKALISGISMMFCSVAVLSVFAFYQQEVDGVVRHEACQEDTIPAAALLNASAAANATQEEEAYCPPSNVPDGLRYLAFCALVTFVCSFSFSFGPITWVILSEIFPTATKGRAMAMATAFNWLGNVVVSSTFIEATGTDSGSVYM